MNEISNYTTVQGVRLNRPTAAICAILGKMGNRFYVGFSEAEQKAMGGGADIQSLMRYQEDIYQWYLLCTATRDQIKEWLSESPEVFRDAVFEYMAETNADTVFLCELLDAIIGLQKELQENAPQVIAEKSPKGKGESRKKKVTRRLT